MNAKNLVIGSLVGLVALYILGYILFDTVFADFYAQNAGSATGVAREEPLIWAAVLLVAFLALIALGNGVLGWATGLFGVEGITLERIFGWVFAPVAWIALLAIIGLCLWMLHRRIRAYEVVK